MSDVNRLVFAVIEFLEGQVQLGHLTPDSVESIEVAIQCLETAYGLDTNNEETASQLRTGQPLLEIFTSATSTNADCSAAGGAAVHSKPTETQYITPEQKSSAEQLKADGNNYMKSERYKQALECYTQAISVDNSNAVYYCNRAAAYSKLDEHVHAIDDCKSALEIDAKYSKAYGRMGLAFTSLNEHEQARDAYKKAIELDPNNASYVTNLKIAEQKLKETNLGSGGATVPGLGGLGGFGGLGAGGMPDMSALLGNPALMNMASTMMQNPEMQRLMHGMLGNAMQGGGGEAPTGDANTNPSASMANLLQAGQQLAREVQTSNPELVDQLREQLSSQGGQDPTQPPEPEEK